MLAMEPLQGLAPRLAALGVATLQDEIVQERAAALGRTTRAFEEALAAFVRSNDEAAPGGREREARRERLLDRAGEALWHFVVQREACGLRNTEAVLRELGVPPAVRLRMGVRQRPTGRQRG